jgi:3-deoxy-D-manno-octulosonate 8-phosphate phosphatase (KDO 8-P phosphatase)
MINLENNLRYLKGKMHSSLSVDALLVALGNQEAIDLRLLEQLCKEEDWELFDLLEKDLSFEAKPIKLLLMDCDGVLTRGEMIVNEDGSSTKIFNVKDGMGIKRAQEAGMFTGIISAGTSTGIVEKRAENLAMTHCYVGKRPKLDVLNEWLEALNLSIEEVAYIGDDVNDLPILEKAGLAFCPNNAVSAVKKHPKVRILKSLGGEGCLREMVEEYLLA